MGDAAEKQDGQAPVAMTPEQFKAFMKAMAPREWYTTVEAAEYLSLSRHALLKHVERGNITPDNANARGKVSGHRFRKATLDSFLGGK